MGTIEMFVVICTVVLLCSWGYIIWSNWNSDKLVRFPPYGFDSCPIGYVLNEQGTSCQGKVDYNDFFNGGSSVKSQPVMQSHPTSLQVCKMFEDVQKESGDNMIFDGIPNKHSHKDWTNNKMYSLLNNCCDHENDEDKKGCNSLQFASVIGQPDSTLDG